MFLKMLQIIIPVAIPVFYWYMSNADWFYQNVGW